MHLLASFPFLRLFLHDGPPRTFEAKWQGFVSSADLREATTEVLRLARQHRVTAWVSDERQLGPTRPDDLRWAATYVLPELRAIGVQRFALVESENPLNQMLQRSNASKVATESAMEIRSFSTPLEARAWAQGR
jgi:hypothetical protein